MEVNVARPLKCISRHVAVPELETEGESTMRRLESRWAWKRQIVATAIVGGLAAPVVAQESRTEERARQQSEKPLAANEATSGERFFGWLEDYLSDRDHGYVTVGNLMPSSGFAPGLGYRGVIGDFARFNVRGAWSVRNYTLGEGVVEIPLPDERFELGGLARWRDGSELPFYGLGDTSTKAQRSSYALQTVDLGGSATWRPARWFHIGAGASAMLVESGNGDGRYPSIETVFDPSTAPGLQAQPDYLHLEGTAAIDWRESKGYTRSGGYYAVTFHRYDDRSDDLYTFNELEADVRQFIPLLNEHWVFALRGQLRTTDLDSGQQVPFFMLPGLGGSTTLRAYPDGRFRDRHAMLLSAEYRWIPGRVLDMALFFDAGKVTARRSDLDFEDLRTSYGIGARFHAPLATVLRVDAAHGREGYRVHFVAGKSF